MSRSVKNKNPTRFLYMTEILCIERIKLLPVYITLHIRSQQPGVGSFPQIVFSFSIQWKL